MAVSGAENDFPRGPVRLIDPFGAGGGPDLLARAIAPALEERWGRPVRVENHPGAGSTAGPALVAKAQPDGCTLLVNTSAHAYSAVFASSLPYDPLADFTPITALSSQPYVLVAGVRAGFSTLPELVEAAKTGPTEIRFGSSGVGTGTHIGVELLQRDLGIRTLHVPSHGQDSIADTVAHTVAGRTAFAMSPISIALPHILEGRLIPLGVTTARRSRILPDVPTLAEAGAPGFDFPIWYGALGAGRNPCSDGSATRGRHRRHPGAAADPCLALRPRWRPAEHVPPGVRRVRPRRERTRRSDRWQRVEGLLPTHPRERLPLDLRRPG